MCISLNLFPLRIAKLGFVRTRGGRGKNEREQANRASEATHEHQQKQQRQYNKRKRQPAKTALTFIDFLFWDTFRSQYSCDQISAKIILNQ